MLRGRNYDRKGNSHKRLWILVHCWLHVYLAKFPSSVLTNCIVRKEYNIDSPGKGKSIPGRRNPKLWWRQARVWAAGGVVKNLQLSWSLEELLIINDKPSSLLRKSVRWSTWDLEVLIQAWRRRTLQTGRGVAGRQRRESVGEAGDRLTRLRWPYEPVFDGHWWVLSPHEQRRIRTYFGRLRINYLYRSEIHDTPH